jgi:hypothetical protein
VDRKERQDEDGYRCECGRWHEFPDLYPERQHILYTLICCDCARIYTVVQGAAELRNKPHWAWKTPRR